MGLPREPSTQFASFCLSERDPEHKHSLRGFPEGPTGHQRAMGGGEKVRMCTDHAVQGHFAG